jgi:CBS-domain-containing membrane protein
VNNGQNQPKRRRPVLTHVIDPKLRKGFRNYVLQSLIATGICCVMLISLDVIIPGALVASLGASTFIVFAAPDNRAARPRGLLGGQLIGTGVGLCCSLMLQWGLLSNIMSVRFETAVFGSIAVGLAIFLMVMIDMEHPPAAGTALSFVVARWSVYSIAFVAGASIFLTVVRLALGRRLKNLY